MLHILLLILKIIGIIVLVIIGLLLLIALSILIVPVRYKGRFTYQERPEGYFKLSWLLHILTFRVDYKDSLTAAVRIFGYPVLKRDLFKAEAEDEEEDFTADDSAPQSAVPDGDADSARKAGDIAGQSRPDRADEEYVEPRSGEKRPAPKQADRQTDMADTANTAAAGHKAENASKPAEKDHGSGSEDSDSEKKGPLSAVYRRIREKIRYAIDNICDKLKTIREKKEQFFAFWNDEENRKTFSLIFKQGKRLLKHIMPGKIKGRVAFGFEDPYTTGQVLMYASPFLGWYHKYLSPEPYFDRQIFEADVRFRGRIRTVTALYLVIKVYRDKNFRKLLKAFRQ